MAVAPTDALPCSIYRTLSVALQDPPIIPPVNGYTIKWRVVGTTTWNVVSNLYGTVLQISNVPSCYSIEGTIQADCAGGSSNPTTFAITGNLSSCQNYTLLENAVYTYTSCGAIQSTDITVTTAPKTICAISGTLFSRTGATWSSNGQLCTLT